MSYNSRSTKKSLKTGVNSEWIRGLRRKFRVPLTLDNIRKWACSIIFTAAVIGAVVVELILFFRDTVPPTFEDYNMADAVDYGEALTVEDEYRQIFHLIDSIDDGLLTLQEFEAFALFRFRGHSPNSELDEFGIGRPPVSTVESSIIDDAFLNSLDLNGDLVLNDDELTAENVKALFDKAKEVMDGYDKDGNQLVTWDEFYQP